MAEIEMNPVADEHSAGVARRATQLYGDRARKEKLSAELRMSTGDKIDYILVFKLPEDVCKHAASTASCAPLCRSVTYSYT